MLADMMKPRIKVLTLCMSDRGRSLEFYRDGLGLRTECIIGVLGLLPRSRRASLGARVEPRLDRCRLT
jgi:hypothetical protein